MTLALKGRILLQILQGNCVLVNVQARNPLGAAQGRSQGKLLTYCKVDPLPHHLELVQQGGGLLMTYVLVPLLVYKLSSLLSSATIQTFQDSGDPEWFLVLKLIWEEATISKMWLLGRLAKKKCTSMTRVKVLRGVFCASFMKTSIPQS